MPNALHYFYWGKLNRKIKTTLCETRMGGQEQPASSTMSELASQLIFWIISDKGVGCKTGPKQQYCGQAQSLGDPPLLRDFLLCSGGDALTPFLPLLLLTPHRLLLQRNPRSKTTHYLQAHPAASAQGKGSCRAQLLVEIRYKHRHCQHRDKQEKKFIYIFRAVTQLRQFTRKKLQEENSS